MSWFDSLIAAIRDTFTGVANQVTDTIDGAINGVYGALNFVTGGIQNTIYQTTNTVGNAISAVRNQIGSQIGGAQSAIQNTIGAVQNNIIGQIDDVQGSVYNAANGVVNQVTHNISGALSGVSSTLYGVQNTLTNQIGNVVTGVQNTLSPILGGISSQINTGLTQVGNTFGSIATSLTQNIDQGLTGLASGIGSLASGIQSGIDNALSNVGSLVATTQETISSTLANLSPGLAAIQEAIGKGVDFKPLFDFISDPLSGFKATVMQGLKERVAAKQDILDKVARGEYAEFADVVKALADPPPPLDPISGFLDAIYGMISLVFAFQQIAPIYARTLVTQVNQQHQTAIFSPADLANMVNQNIAEKGQAIQEGAWSGFNAARMEQLILLAGEPPGINTVLEMWRRGFVDENQVNNAILESRLKSKYLEPTKKMRFVLPPIGDVIRMAVREAWDDGVASQFGYDADFPVKVRELAPQLGIDPDWITRYWRSHWQLPSFSELAEMLHRSKETGVTPTIVENALRVNDVPEYWRQKLIAISYNPFTRVDIRRMYKVGVLTFDQVLQAYRDIGYDETRARALADFTVKLEDSQGQLDPDTLDRKVYTALEALFIRGKRSEGDLRAAMAKFGWGQVAIDEQVEIAKLRQEAYNKVESKDASGLTETTVQRQIVERQIDLYVRNQGDLGAVSALMQEYGWGSEIQDLVLKRATLDKIFDAAPTQKQALKDLSISAVLTAYAAHAFSVDETRTRLVSLGLSAEDAQTEIDIKDYQEASSLRTKIISALQKAFLQNRLTEANATSSLIQFGFSVDEANNYLALWSLDKSLQHKDFTEAQLATFLKHGVIEPTQYQAELANLGWSAEQIALWSALRGADTSITG